MTKIELCGRGGSGEMSQKAMACPLRPHGELTFCHESNGKFTSVESLLIHDLCESNGLWGYGYLNGTWVTYALRMSNDHRIKLPCKYQGPDQCQTCLPESQGSAKLPRNSLCDRIMATLLASTRAVPRGCRRGHLRLRFRVLLPPTTEN